MSVSLQVLYPVTEQTNFDYNYYLGYWTGDKTKYTLIVYKNRNADFEFTNYKQQERVGRNFGGFEYSPEQYVKKDNGKLYSYISWSNYYCDLVYEPIDKNKMKAVFTGDWDGTIIYTRVLVDVDRNNKEQVAK